MTAAVQPLFGAAGVPTIANIAATIAGAAPAAAAAAAGEPLAEQG